jgi:hypothetical protein
MERGLIFSIPGSALLTKNHEIFFRVDIHNSELSSLTNRAPYRRALRRLAAVAVNRNPDPEAAGALARIVCEKNAA